jgi:hypothetical protein
VNLFKKGSEEMSQWTQVCGCIRYDALRMVGLPYSTLNEIKTLVGNTVSFKDPPEKWDKCNVPCGSEGSIQFVFWSNPSGSSLAAFTVGVFGDLRDFGTEDVPKIREWFERVTSGEGVMVRNAILEISVEGTDEPVILRHINK